MAVANKGLITFAGGSSLSVLPVAPVVRLIYTDAHANPLMTYDMTPTTARTLAVELVAMARLVDPDSADRRRLIAAAEADLAAEIAARTPSPEGG